MSNFTKTKDVVLKASSRSAADWAFQILLFNGTELQRAMSASVSGSQNSLIEARVDCTMPCNMLHARRGQAAIALTLT
jgi:hypothetical protein